MWAPPPPTVNNRFIQNKERTDLNVIIWRNLRGLDYRLDVQLKPINMFVHRVNKS